MGMEQTAKNSALQRKLRAGRAGQAVQAMTPARAFRLSTERAAAQDLGLRLDVLGVELRQGPVEELGADLADDGVILLLHTGAAPAALVCDLQMVSALVEVQTLGQAQARPAAPRVLTATDAALTQPLLAGVSRRMAGLLPADAAALPPLTPVKRMPDMRALVLEMGTGGYQLWRCSCALGHERCAEFALLLPAAEPPAAAQLPDRTQAAPTPVPASGASCAPRRDRGCWMCLCLWGWRCAVCPCLWGNCGHWRWATLWRCPPVCWGRRGSIAIQAKWWPPGPWGACMVRGRCGCMRGRGRPRQPVAARRAPLRPHPTCRCQPLLRMASLATVASPHKKGGHLRPPFGFVLCGPLLGPKGCPQRWPLAVGGHGIQRGAQLI